MNKKKVQTQTDRARSVPALPEVLLHGQPIRQGSRKEVDLVFLIDTTGSMSDKINGILSTCADFVQSFGSLNLDHRVAVVGFGDLTVVGDHIVATRFMTSVDLIGQSLLKIPRFSGGGNDGESVFEAVNVALGLQFRDKAVKVFVLITDEPALHTQYSGSSILNRLVAANVMVYVIAPKLDYYVAFADKTGGQWYQITSVADFSKLLETLRAMAKKISTAVDEIHRLAGGSVKEYLRLKA